MKFLDSWMEALILIDFFWRIIRTVGWVWKLLVDRNIKLKASSINEWKFLIKIFLQDQKAFSGPDLLRYLISLFLSSINFHKLSVCQLFKILNFQESTWPHQLHSQKLSTWPLKALNSKRKKDTRKKPDSNYVQLNEKQWTQLQVIRCQMSILIVSHTWLGKN